MDAMNRYAQWRADFADDQQIQSELLKIQGDEKEIADRFYTDLAFGTAGMRGVLGAGPNRMNRYSVRRATQGLADLIGTVPGGAERGVTIAYDSRRMSPEFAKEAALVLCARGIRALLFDSLRPVPVLSFALRHLGAIAGIVITASHNPPQYNGYKVYWEDGGQMPPDLADQVYAAMGRYGYADADPMGEAEALEKGLLRYIEPEVDDAYIRHVKSLCIRPELARQMGDKLAIVYSPLNGSGNVPVRRILAEIGMNRVFVVAEQEQPDPDFTTVGTPNPENLSAYRLARELALEKNADLVFATDPDCDRLGCLIRDEKGEFQVLTGNQIGCLLLDYILSSLREQGRLPENGAVVKSIVSTQMAGAIAQAYGAAMIDVLTGFKFIAEKIEAFSDGSHTFLFGFEESYGYLSGTAVRDKDAVNASMLLAEAAAYHLSCGRTLGQALEAMYEKYGYFCDRVTSIELAGMDGLARMAAAMGGLRQNPPEEIGGLGVLRCRDYLTGIAGMPPSDVLYYELEGGAWLCIRPSGTEPKIKLYAGTNAFTKEEAEHSAGALLEAGEVLLKKS